MKKFASLIGGVIFSSLILFCNVYSQDFAKTDNDKTSCNTESFTKLTVSSIIDVSTLKMTEDPVGVMVRTQSKAKIHGIMVYVKNDAPFYLEVYSGKQSESGFMNRKDKMKQYFSKPLLCKPSGKGYYTIDLSSYPITSQKDLFFVFSPAKSNNVEAQQLAVYKDRPKTRFCVVTTPVALTYLSNPMIESKPIFISIL